MRDQQEHIERLDLNSVSPEALSQLPGVGPALAGRIAAARPFASVDDLERVSGLGASTLERIRDQVQVTSPVPAAAASSGPATYSRGQVTGLLFISVILSVALSVILTLAALLGINGTLDMGRSAAVQDLQSQTERLTAQAQTLQGRLDAVDQQLHSLQGLSGRISQVEAQTSQLSDDVQQARTDAQQLTQQVDDLAATARELDRRQSRQESVFQALADLLAPWAGTATPSPTPSGSN